MLNNKTIPHGHGLSYKKGIADGLLGTEREDLKGYVPQGHDGSYKKGVEEGKELAVSINSRVRD